MDMQFFTMSTLKGSLEINVYNIGKFISQSKVHYLLIYINKSSKESDKIYEKAVMLTSFITHQLVTYLSSRDVVNYDKIYNHFF